MAISLKSLPPQDCPRFDAWLAELPADQRSAISGAASTLGPLLESAPYLLGLAQENAAWLVGALSDTADGAFIDIIEAVERAGREATDEDTLSPVLRIGKGRTALLAAMAETGGAWTTAQSTAALSDLADAALDAVLNLLMRQAAERGLLAIPAEQANAANSGLAIFALGKHGGQELNYSSDIDIVAFYDPEKGVLSRPLGGATKVYSRMVQKLAGLMEDRRAHGYVFRTDLRLRPDPGSTPVALSPSTRRSPITKAAARTGSAPPGSRRAPCAGDIECGPRLPQGTRALCLAQTSRFRDHRRYPGDEASDQHRQECRRYPGRGSQRQARAAAASARSSSSPRPSN
jgi:glutamate-ammonia-ligase adenylyltransferase